MKKYLFLLFALSIIFSSCVPEKLIIARYIKECKEVNANSISHFTMKIDHYDSTVDSSKIVDISYYIDTDSEIHAILHLENGHPIVISVANEMLKDNNLIGRQITYHEKKPIYKQDTVFTKAFDTVFVSNLICEKKTVQGSNYIVKVYDYVTERSYKATTNKATFDALMESPAYIYVPNTQWHRNTNYCIPWEYALNLKGFKMLEIIVNQNIYNLSILEQ